METIQTFFRDYVAWLSMPSINIIDIIEILVIAFAVYHIVIWVKDTRAWVLLKGIIVLCFIWLVAAILDMNVLLWIFQNVMVIGITAIVVVFQPEFRNALEQLGRKSFTSITPFDDSKAKYERYSDRCIHAVIKAVYEMAKVKTGALIVVERDIQCREFERTGIPIDAEVSSQLLINIFEHNTPLHDGAVILRENRVVSATCYLPLSDNLALSKELGTRHRAGLGVSEVSDSLTIIVSEETGMVSVAREGKLKRNVDAESLEKLLRKISRKASDGARMRWWKGRRRA
ncbi:MAG: TIGR00159 family protein [Eubacterium sp.]|jgi:diadenylate cyclase|nr:TIGR00159 family protein [Eubacterium sp.]